MSQEPSEASQSQLKVKLFRNFVDKYQKRVYNTQSDRIIQITVKLYIHLAKVTKKISKVNIEQITSEVDIKSIIKGSSTFQENLYSHTKLFFWGPLSTKPYHFCTRLFSHPETATCKSDLLFPFIKCNSIPHTFFTGNTCSTFHKQPRTDLYISILQIGEQKYQ